MNADPQAQLLAQNQKLERLENRICEVQGALQILVSREQWVVRHFWPLVACGGLTSLGFLAGTLVGK